MTVKDNRPVAHTENHTEVTNKDIEELRGIEQQLDSKIDSYDRENQQTNRS
jgi:hypothetical protein